MLGASPYVITLVGTCDAGKKEKGHDPPEKSVLEESSTSLNFSHKIRSLKFFFDDK